MSLKISLWVLIVFSLLNFLDSDIYPSVADVA